MSRVSSSTQQLRPTGFRQRQIPRSKVSRIADRDLGTDDELRAEKASEGIGQSQMSNVAKRLATGVGLRPKVETDRGGEPVEARYGHPRCHAALDPTQLSGRDVRNTSHLGKRQPGDAPGRPKLPTDSDEVYLCPPIGPGDSRLTHKRDREVEQVAAAQPRLD